MELGYFCDSKTFFIDAFLFKQVLFTSDFRSGLSIKTSLSVNSKVELSLIFESF